MLQVFMSGCVTSHKVKCSCENDFVWFCRGGYKQPDNSIIWNEGWNFLGDKIWKKEIKLWRVKKIDALDGEIKLYDCMSGRPGMAGTICVINLILEEKNKKENTYITKVVCLNEYPISEGDIIELYRVNANIAYLKTDAGEYSFNPNSNLGFKTTFKNMSNKKAREWDVMK